MRVIPTHGHFNPFTLGFILKHFNRIEKGYESQNLVFSITSFENIKFTVLHCLVNIPDELVLNYQLARAWCQLHLILYEHNSKTSQ